MLINPQINKEELCMQELTKTKYQIELFVLEIIKEPNYSPDGLIKNIK